MYVYLYLCVCVCVCACVCARVCICTCACVCARGVHSPTARRRNSSRWCRTRARSASARVPPSARYSAWSARRPPAPPPPPASRWARWCSSAQSERWDPAGPQRRRRTLTAHSNSSRDIHSPKISLYLHCLSSVVAGQLLRDSQCGQRRESWPNESKFFKWHKVVFIVILWWGYPLVEHHRTTLHHVRKAPPQALQYKKNKKGLHKLINEKNNYNGGFCKVLSADTLVAMARKAKQVHHVHVHLNEANL